MTDIVESLEFGGAELKLEIILAEPYSLKVSHAKTGQVYPVHKCLLEWNTSDIPNSMAFYAEIFVGFENNMPRYHSVSCYTNL